MSTDSKDPQTPEKRRVGRTLPALADLEKCQECTLCRERGSCCYFDAPVQVGDHVLAVTSRLHCPHLNVAEGLCGRYATREEVAWCGKVGDPMVLWPDFCVHRNPLGVVSHTGSHLRALGLDGAEVEAILDEADRQVRARAPAGGLGLAVADDGSIAVAPEEAGQEK